MPLFYTQPAPVDANRHRGKSLRDNPGFGFSVRTNSVPVSGAEFALAQRHYPIVFSGQDGAVPVAVLGLRADENLFVRRDGTWEPNLYIPAYVRRYPFVFIEAAGGQLILAIDEGGGFVVDGGKLPLFDAENKPTNLVNSALQFCAAYQNNHKATAEYVAALQANDVLVDNQAQATIAGTERLSLAGFKVVDEARFNKLPAATLEAWREKGWLAWTYAHLLSFGCWNALANLAAERKKAAA
ncbi:SapC family protein [Vineibacter terrae]|uniref:SapC family protein n=2 Tax=Vineibacter terrae TaxID=2586908 RepID=A0A5C8PGL5_9HYPH|nr:SapC family protein [Vineibacter terrae]